MITRAVRLHGKKDLRLDAYELPETRSDEIRAKVVSDTICMSTYKAYLQGSDHKRVPENVLESPVVVGHEICGIIEEVGNKWKERFSAGDKFILQPARPGKVFAPGYSYGFCGGDAERIIIPDELISDGCLIKYAGDAFFKGSLSEPVSCLISALRANFHSSADRRSHINGIKKSGSTAILGGAGTMGIGMVKLILASENRPSALVVTDTDSGKLFRASRLVKREEAERLGVKLIFVNPENFSDPIASMKRFAGGDFDDVFVFAPSGKLIEDAQSLLGYDGCLNFFAGPTERNFSARLNFYDVHYSSLHVVGTSGGDTDDMLDAAELISSGVFDPSPMITHICGLDALTSVIPALPTLGAGKIICYTGISQKLTPISDLERLGKSDPLMKRLADAIKPSGVWNSSAERILLDSAKGSPLC